jgi:hypothetical protein
MSKLEDAYHVKEQIRSLEVEVAPLNNKLKKLKASYQKMLSDLKEECIDQEGNLIIVDKGRNRRNVNVSKLVEYDKDIYELLSEYLTIPIGKVEETLKDYPDKDTIIDNIVDIEINHNYDVIDIMDGE